MSITGFDHVAIPVENVEAMLSFYRDLGFDVRDGDGTFYSVQFGDHRINFHDPVAWRSQSFTLRGPNPNAVPGCGDFCFVWEGTQEALLTLLDGAKAKVIEGPVERTGGRNKGHARGKSFYIRDPDSNLLEFIVYP